MKSKGDSPMPPIYLVGYMYAGKTTIGRKLASKLGFRFVDTDQLFEERFHTSIPIFFDRYGEEAFRNLERQVLLSTALLHDTVVATGGGTPCFADNMEWILDHGTAVYLQLSFDAVCARMACSRKVRPVLQSMSLDDRRCFVRQQLSLRIPFYAQAPITFDALNPNVDLLAQRLLFSSQQSPEPSDSI